MRPHASLWVYLVVTLDGWSHPASIDYQVQEILILSHGSQRLMNHLEHCWQFHEPNYLGRNCAVSSSERLHIEIAPPEEMKRWDLGLLVYLQMAP